MPKNSPILLYQKKYYTWPKIIFKNFAFFIKKIINNYNFFLEKKNKKKYAIIYIEIKNRNISILVQRLIIFGTKEIISGTKKNSYVPKIINFLLYPDIL